MRVVASLYLVARAWVGPDAKGAALAMGAVVDIGTTDRLVGRVAELGVLGMSIGRAAAGSVQVVAISGEAGIGKSRLASEGLADGQVRGFRTLESAAGRLHRDLSYAPIVEALRPLVAEAALVDGLSDLARLFDGLRVPPLVALGDPGWSAPECSRRFAPDRAGIAPAATRDLYRRPALGRPGYPRAAALCGAWPASAALFVPTHLPRRRGRR